MAVLTQNVQWLAQYLMMPVKTTATMLTDLGTGFTLDDAHAGLIGEEGVTGNTTFGYGLPVTNFPHLKPSAASLELAMATGGAFMDTAQIVTTSNSVPGTTLEMPLDEYSLSFLLGSLFQNGASHSDAGTNANFVSYNSYTSPAVRDFFVLVRPMEDSSTTGAGDAVSHVLNGCVVNSVQITISEGQVWTGSAEVMAAEWTADGSKIAGASAFSVVTIPNVGVNGYLKVENTNISFDRTGAAGYTAFNTPEISFTLSNGLIPQFYNSTTILKFLMGDFSGEGTYRVPWGAGASDGHSTPLTRFAAGTVSQIGIYDIVANEGHTCADDAADLGAYQFELTCKPTDTDFGGDAEQGSDVSFKLVTDKSTTPDNVAFSGSIAYAITRGLGWTLPS